MKILQVIPYFCFGGAETMCENLCYAQRGLGHQVTVVSLYDRHTPISERMEQAGVRIRYLDKKLGLDVSMVPKLVKILREEKPDVVHTHLDVVKYAALAAKLAGVKRCVHTVHNVAEKEAEGLARKINNIYFHLGWAKPVALSPLVRQTIAQVYGLPLSGIPVVFNGIDLGRCMAKTDYTLSSPARIVHIGRFNEQKNHAGMLRSFRLILQEQPDTVLRLVGDGELREQVEVQAREMGIGDRVEFLGSQSNVHPFLQSADLFLLPSSYEGMPMTVIEAMGTGLPIVATEVGGLADMITHGHSGLLVPCDEGAVAEACVSALRDRDLRQRMGTAAQADSVRFSAAHMAGQYCRLYE